MNVLEKIEFIVRKKIEISNREFTDEEVFQLEVDALRCLMLSDHTLKRATQGKKSTLINKGEA